MRFDMNEVYININDLNSTITDSLRTAGYKVYYYYTKDQTRPSDVEFKFDPQHEIYYTDL